MCFRIRSRDMAFILLFLLLLYSSFLISRYFLWRLRLFVLFSVCLRLSFIDIVFYFLKCVWICLYAMLMIVQIILLGLTFPRVFANHIHICLGWFNKLLIFLKRMLFKSVDIPCKQFKHIWVLPSIFGCFSKYLIRKIYLI